MSHRTHDLEENIVARIQLTAHITGDVADVFALNAALVDAVEGEFAFTLGEADRLFVNVDEADLPAALAVLHGADALGQLTFHESEIDPLLTASL